MITRLQLYALRLGSRDAEQTHMTLGVRAPGRHWKHRWALSVLNAAIGGGLSSRLFQQIREERGLAYTVYSTVDTFADTGALSVYTACLPERFGDVVKVTTNVLQTVARDGITADECRIAKGSLRGGLVLGLEDSGSRMNRIGRSELNYGEHRSIGQTLAQIDSVTLDLGASGRLTAKIRSGGTPCSSINTAMRVVSTRVLPEPAPARMRIGPSGASTAARCSGFNSSRFTVTVAASKLRSGVHHDSGSGACGKANE